MELLAIILLLLLSAFFAGSETAFISANRLRTEITALSPGIPARNVRWAYGHPGALRAATLTGYSVTMIAYATLIAAYVSPPLQRLFADVAGLGAGFSVTLVLISQTLIASVILLIIREVVAASIMRAFADRVIFIAAPSLRLFHIVLLPFFAAAAWAAKGLARLFGVSDAAVDASMQREFELRLADHRAAGGDVAEDDGATLLENVLEMADVRVKESMVPRTNIIAVDETASIDEIRRRLVESGLSKLPVYRDNIDEIVGIVFAHDLFAQPGSLAEIIRPARYVPESKLSKALLREFLSSSSSIAIVIDEYGGTAGLVTREDLLEELFGDIRDEFDVEEEIMRQVGENVFIVSGRVRVEELNERYDLRIEEGDYETIAGYVLEHTGTIPSLQEELQIDHLQITILKATANRIDLMRLVRLAGAVTH